MAEGVSLPRVTQTILLRQRVSEIINGPGSSDNLAHFGDRGFVSSTYNSTGYVKIVKIQMVHSYGKLTA